MAELSDEVLMAYADGALTPDVRERVTGILAAHPEFHERLRIFEVTGRTIGLLFEDMICRAATPTADPRGERAYGMPHADAGGMQMTEDPGEETGSVPVGGRTVRRPRRGQGLGSATMIGQRRIIVTT